MKTVKILVIAFMALAISSCSQSKEDKFLADLEDFVETFENSSYDYLKDNFESMSNTFFSKVENLYGVDLSKSDHIMECLEASGLNLNEKQKEKAYELEERLLKRAAGLKEEFQQMRETKREERKRQETIDTDLDDDDKSVNLKGNVDKYPVTMHLEINGTLVKGSYYYDKQGPGAQLKLSGTNEDGVLDINETDANGTPTGHFKGKFSSGVFKGMFVTNQGKQMPFMLSESGDESADSSFDEGDSFDNDDDSDLSMDKGDSSVDAFLDEYEKFWKRYVSFIKKMDKNNPMAMTDYAKWLNQYNEYNNKLQKMRGKMSVNQINRMNQMNLELLKEMDKIK
ncbi:MAG: hypothetical protein IKD75_03225 [Prevotella sp.]|nr:hypothetical protein [Prevotella sp.]